LLEYGVTGEDLLALNIKDFEFNPIITSLLSRRVEACKAKYAPPPPKRKRQTSSAGSAGQREETASLKVDSAPAEVVVVEEVPPEEDLPAEGFFGPDSWIGSLLGYFTDVVEEEGAVASEEGTKKTAGEPERTPSPEKRYHDDPLVLSSVTRYRNMFDESQAFGGWKPNATVWFVDKTFETDELGVKVNSEGLVTKVRADSEAAEHGVRIGWTVVRINKDKFTARYQLTQAEDSGEPYTIKFKVLTKEGDENEAPVVEESYTQAPPPVDDTIEKSAEIEKSTNDEEEVKEEEETRLEEVAEAEV